MINNSEKNRLERERIKIKRELYKANKLIRDQKEKEKEEKEAKEAFEQAKIKKPISNKNNQFSTILLEKLEDNSITEDVSLMDMLGIKSTDIPSICNTKDENNENTNTNINENVNENDRHYAPDFI